MSSALRLSILTFFAFFMVLFILVPSVHSVPVPVSKVSNISEDWGVKITNPDTSPEPLPDLKLQVKQQVKEKRSDIPTIRLLGRTISPPKCNQEKHSSRIHGTMKIPKAKMASPCIQQEDGIPLGLFIFWSRRGK
ncbi:hypothetical protein BD779DRAFT_1481563 [Infundibulicybe gibba]|nr:hypothetical protein BD779DRAFT_1481563 [Infundibulicybe gibba]